MVLASLVFAPDEVRGPGWRQRMARAGMPPIVTGACSRAKLQPS